MDKLDIRGRGPEEEIVQRLIPFLLARRWHVMRTHGNMFQCGFPDLFICHSTYGQRWVEVKNAKSYSFTAAQKDQFPKMTANGGRIWILVDASEAEYKKLSEEPNWFKYWKFN